MKPSQLILQNEAYIKHSLSGCLLGQVLCIVLLLGCILLNPNPQYLSVELILPVILLICMALFFAVCTAGWLQVLIRFKKMSQKEKLEHCTAFENTECVKRLFASWFYSFFENDLTDGKKKSAQIRHDIEYNKNSQYHSLWPF
ncbi:MAG: hypothetical protein HUJ55_05935 [Ileibacterium sp.]|nr:hypothetical protein [Ileibacterium sp.]